MTAHPRPDPRAERPEPGVAAEHTQLSLIEAAENTVRRAVTAQREDADPKHKDFYAWGAALDEVTHRLGHLCVVLARQIGSYGDRRVLRDDAGQDPYARLDEMRAHLADLERTLGQANAHARAFHSAASHIAVDPNAETDPR